MVNRFSNGFRDKDPTSRMRIVKKTYKVSGPSGTSLITTFQVKGLRPRKMVKVPAKKSVK